jgi:hypothetical protein
MNGVEILFLPFLKLAAEPMEIDLVVEVPINAVINPNNPIAIIFGEHNILEFKSHSHTTTIYDFYKTMGYTCFQMANKGYENCSADSMSFSLIVDRFPQGLFKKLKDENSNAERSANAAPSKEDSVVIKEQDGIYHIKGKYPFRAQVIVLKELDSNQFPCLKAISKYATKEDLEKFLSFVEINNLDESNTYIDIIFELSYSLHKELYKQIRKEPSMRKVLMELMKEDVDAIVSEAVAATKAETRAKDMLEVAARLLAQRLELPTIAMACDLPEAEVRDLADGLGLEVVEAART